MTDKNPLEKLSKQVIEDWFKDPWKYADEHRRGINDMEWASMQSMEDPIYSYGDIVEFKVGGFGRINTISSGGSWPPSYSVMKVPDKPFHSDSKCAWHYEGDILRLVKKASSEVSEIMATLNDDHNNSLAAHVMRAERKNHDPE
jgi:hypothetical protein